jgi:hypothetical protein
MSENSKKLDTDLTSHRFVREVLQSVVPLIANEYETENLTVADSYKLGVFDAISALIQSFDLLTQSRRLTTLMPADKYLKALNFNRHEWLEYHISTFLITFATVGDEALLLVSEIQCLGIDPKNCRAGIVKSNKWVKDTIIPTKLDAIEHVIKLHRGQRNALVHQGKLPSLGSLFESNTLDHLKRVSFVLQHKPDSLPEEMRIKCNAGYVNELAKIDKVLRTKLDQLQTAVMKLLTEMHKFYSQRLSIFPSIIACKKSTS